MNSCRLPYRACRLSHRRALVSRLCRQAALTFPLSVFKIVCYNVPWHTLPLIHDIYLPQTQRVGETLSSEDPSGQTVELTGERASNEGPNLLLQ